MKAMILLMISFLTLVHADPGPIDIPLEKLPAYYAKKDKDARINPRLFDAFGPPPDLYPAIIPGGSDSYDYGNISYPGTYTDNEGCNHVDICPDNPSDPYAPGYGMGPGFLGFGTGSETSRNWKCYIETDCNGLHKVPDDIQNKTEVLFLRFSNFTTLENGDLSSLPPLIKLRIEFSDLETIQPGAFGTQTTLQYLELAGNHISDLQPRTFFELTNLTALDINGNSLSQLSREIFTGLESLKELDLGFNLLTRLADDTFREIPSLQKLKLARNNLTTISKYTFRGLPNLVTLYLNYNQFTIVPTQGLRILPSLAKLHLSGNVLRTVNKGSFRNLKNLKEIWLDQCELAGIPKRTFQGHNLTFLDISQNKLSYLYDLGRIGSHATVQMGLNPWKCDCLLTKTTSWLRKYNITLSSPEPTCRTPYYLTGRRIMELTKELCQPPPVFLQTTTRKAVVISASTSRNAVLNRGDGNSNLIPNRPDGTWAETTYNISELYPVLHPITQTSKPLTSKPTETVRKSPLSTAIYSEIVSTTQQFERVPSVTSNQNILSISTESEEMEEHTPTVRIVTFIAQTLKNVGHITTTTEHPRTNDSLELVKIILIILAGTVVLVIVGFIIYRLCSKRNKIKETDLEMPPMETKREDVGNINGSAVTCTEPVVVTKYDKISEGTTSDGPNGHLARVEEPVDKENALNSEDKKTTDVEPEDIEKPKEDTAISNESKEIESAEKSSKNQLEESESHEISTKKEIEEGNTDSQSNEEKPEE